MLKEKSLISLPLGAIFQNGRPLILLSSISPLLIALATWSWCVNLCFLGHRIQWNYFWTSMTNSSLANYTMIPIFVNKVIRKSTMVNIFSSHCFIIMVLGSKLIFSWSKNAMKLFIDHKIYSFITKLDYNCNILENNNPEFATSSI